MVDPNFLRTPITVNLRPYTRTCFPIGFNSWNRFSAISFPRTMTGAPVNDSDSV